MAASSRVLNEPASVATSTMSPSSAAMDGAAVAGAGVAGAGVAAVVEHADTTRATAATESRMVRFMSSVPSGEVTGLGLRRGVPRHLTVPTLVRPGPTVGWDEGSPAPR